ncbi:MAG: hypothetical protein K1060chlam5_01070 [Candidatus Anoxychlamydiales bacterium]|nr:hypothetical protein [Candidatus Anoxychlamydiales bacterium]
MRIDPCRIRKNQSEREVLIPDTSSHELDDMTNRILSLLKDRGVFSDSEWQELNSPLSLQQTTDVSSLPKLDGDKIAEVLVSEAAFTISTDPKPVVATYGCAPCVAVGGYDPTNKIAFIVHFTNAEEVRRSSVLVFRNILKLVEKPIEAPIQLHLRGGLEGFSEDTIAAIKMLMTGKQDLPMEIVSEYILGSDELNYSSLSIDSRTGDVTSYDPLSNSQYRKMSELEAMAAMLRSLDGRVKLVYSPK